MDSDREGFKMFMTEIRTALMDIRNRLPSSTINADSPLELTPLGKEVAECVGSDDIVNKAFEKIDEEARTLVEYDVQNLSFSYLRDTWKPSRDVEDRIKQCAYEHGIGWVSGHGCPCRPAARPDTVLQTG